MSLTKLVRIGDELAIEIPPEVLEDLHLDETTELTITTDGTRLIVEPLSDDAQQPSVEKIMDEVLDRHREAFRKLAE